MLIQGILIIALIVTALLVNIYGDWLWFLSVGYGKVFWTILSTKLSLALIAGIIFFLILFVNLRVARKISQKKTKRKIISLGLIFNIIIYLSVLTVGFAFSNDWKTVLSFFNAAPFGITDPVFGNDISFYTFNLPFYTYILSYFTVVIVVSLFFTFFGYLLYSGFFKVKEHSPTEYMISGVNYAQKLKLDKKAWSHLSILAGFLFLMLAGWFFLERFNVLFSTRGVVFGAAYTDLHIQLPFLLISSVVSGITAILLFLNVKIKNLKLTAYGIGALIGILIISFLIGVAVQKLVVEPNEFNLERPYIQRNINYTLKAYNLEHMDEKPFPVTYDLTKEDIEENKGTIDNIRIWDWRPLIKTYNQLQTFRTYYDFKEMDIDRYSFDGEYRQVMLSPRELNQENLPPKAKTWVNQHLVYTHGYGLVMSPVNEGSKEGLPHFYVKDIPPESDSLSIERPEIYYGEKTDQFIIVKTKTEEFDYPKGQKNVYTSYQGKGGIKLSPIRKLVYTFKFGSIELLVSGSIKPESKIMFYRNIHERVRKIAPFLEYDYDPYLVVSDGKLYWIYDAYTTTHKYPYSEPIFLDVNYIRNPVKVVIDAYDGDVTYYVIDPNDPMIKTYRNVFPDLFKDFSEMPEDLKKHIRYPEDLFKIQAEIYSTYHMKDPRVFYNKEDMWRTPNEIYQGTKQEMIPYYIIMKLPEKEKEEFILMIPFIPRGKENMVGWMAAKSDQPEYGKIVVYFFSKQKLIYGPMQVEARIDQDTEISQMITLWSQMGSIVIRGNTLVIPIEDSILYVEPLYLQAAETGAVPQLKRVIVVFGDRLVMDERLDEALETLFKPGVKEEVKEKIKTVENSIREALEHYNKSQEALKEGNWTEYGEEIEELGKILETLEKRS